MTRGSRAPCSHPCHTLQVLLGRRSRFDFDREVDGMSRVEQAVAFLALLELRKTNEVTLEQARPFAPIRVVRGGQESGTAGERRMAWSARSG